MDNSITGRKASSVALWLECPPFDWEVGGSIPWPGQTKDCRKWDPMPPCLALSIIRVGLGELITINMIPGRGSAAAAHHIQIGSNVEDMYQIQ